MYHPQTVFYAVENSVQQAAHNVFGSNTIVKAYTRILAGRPPAHYYGLSVYSSIKGSTSVEDIIFSFAKGEKLTYTELDLAIEFNEVANYKFLAENIQPFYDLIEPYIVRLFMTHADKLIAAGWKKDA